MKLGLPPLRPFRHLRSLPRTLELLVAVAVAALVVVLGLVPMVSFRSAVLLSALFGIAGAIVVVVIAALRYRVLHERGWSYVGTALALLLIAAATLGVSRWLPARVAYAQAEGLQQAVERMRAWNPEAPTAKGIDAFQRSHRGSNYWAFNKALAQQPFAPLAQRGAFFGAQAFAAYAAWAALMPAAPPEVRSRVLSEGWLSTADLRQMRSALRAAAAAGQVPDSERRAALEVRRLLAASPGRHATRL